MKASAPAVDALAGETPLPFGVGDLMRDVHTGVIVQVTQLNPPHPRTGNIRPGFAWENTTTKAGDKDHTGFCPLVSVGCFVKPGEKLEEKPAPSVTPPAPAAIAESQPAAVAAPAAEPLIASTPVNRVPRASHPPKHRPATPPKKGPSPHATKHAKKAKK